MNNTAALHTTVESIVNASGTRLALSHIAPSSAIAHESEPSGRSAQQPCGVVVLAHGTFSNHRSCRGLASYLASQGHDCWMLDFQGHGLSDKPAVHPGFESMSLEDTEAVVGFLKHRYPGQSIHWVGHSGGGLAILMYLARDPERQLSIGRIVTLGSQATHAATKRSHRVAIQLSALLTRLFGFAPGRWFGIGPEHEFAGVMIQWYGWNLRGRWLGEDGFDYEAALSDLHRPLLCLAGEADRFIAPLAGCRHLYQCHGADEKRFEHCALDKGYREDYSHPRLISSSSAAREIWPMIATWLGTDQ